MRWAIVLFLSLTCLAAQAPDGAPPKPLRERLLERALKGDAEAQFDLAKNYEAGRIGLPRDVVQAEHWYRLAAEQGEPFAQASLGILYQFGKGVKPDLVQACMWYTLAVERTKSGDRETIMEMLDDLNERLTDGQRAEAKRLAREWKPRVTK
ncbi:MAG TPA: tetratricopeptide repeat protein [Bryobacteraceae bacterium]|nr:tetratricopeptide repeat protein [Bryobacteraceae bacterium]